MDSTLSYRHLALFAALAALAFLPGHLLNTYYLYVLNVLMMYAVLSLGLSLLLGWTGQFAFAHIAFFGIGTYGTALLDLRFGIPFLLGMPISAALAGLLGYVIGYPSTRLRTVYLALATFAFAECAQWVFRSWDAVTGGADGLRIKPASVLSYTIDSDARAFPVVAILMLAVLLATLYLERSRLGRHMRAIRDSEHVAAASGIDVTRTKVITVVISAVYAAIAGGMYALFQNFVNPDVFGVQQLVVVLTMVVVGGSASIPGVLLGTVLMGLLPEFLRAAPSSLLVWQEFFYGSVLVLAVMFMPAGIWGVITGLRKPTNGAALATGLRPREAGGAGK